MTSTCLKDLDAILTGDEFIIPTNKEIGAEVSGDIASQRCTYLCGNSLGPLAKRSRSLIEEELQVWATRAVEGHFNHPHHREWMDIANTVTPMLADLIGAKEREVACMGSLTANLHLMLSAFYKPTPSRYKILCESKAFPSDQYAFASQALFHGYDPKDAIVEVFPREGEYNLRVSDILDEIAKQGSAIALVIFSGVQYYTGQLFPMKVITRAAKEHGCLCGWDLAHAIGNVPMSLHEWDVDFAVWCSYKYLNSGPGGIGGLFVHEKWESTKTPQFAGWWGHDPSTRFEMPPMFSPIPGAQGFQQSNPSVFATVSLLGSLQVFKQVGMMQPLRERSVSLTARLEALLRQTGFYVSPDAAARYLPNDPPGFTIITPEEHESRGAQLSLLFLPPESEVMSSVLRHLKSAGVIGDERHPDVIRLTPAPLYNTAKDCERAAECIKQAFKAITKVN
ncbi:hypothetical protein SCLCIDRAFT_9101 [Scleroderma citrinum Foug A]|uniref:Kynureninase n=1 Tax=Scleroderma citrinum Foug A TaxID=1036808 RepID=A0A0C3E1L7_9AGAM|nr:hypothetical protein SCLCIDRAFT_9101 [Scleroderma citrinum Foug A]